MDEGERERGSVKRFPPRTSESRRRGGDDGDERRGRSEGNGGRGARRASRRRRRRRTTRARGKRREIFEPEGAGARGAVGEGAAAGLALLQLVYVNSVEQKLPDGVRGVVKGVRCELRAFADMFFATAWASFALTTRVAGTGLGMAKRASERSLSAAMPMRDAEARDRRSSAGEDNEALAELGSRRRGSFGQLKTHFVRGDARCEGQGERGDEEFRRRQARHSGGRQDARR